MVQALRRILNLEPVHAQANGCNLERGMAETMLLLLDCSTI
jgi:hypothetical protein